MKKVSYIITVINLLCEILYESFGYMTTTELGRLNWIFYIFRPEYMVISGLITLLNIIILIYILVAYKNQRPYTAIIMLVNIEFIVYYIRFISMQ